MVRHVRGWVAAHHVCVGGVVTYEDAIRAEVERWPGASVSFEMGGKHPRAVLAFGDATRFTPYPATPGDNYRGLQNKTKDVRHMLTEMGAERAPEPKSEGPRRERNPGAAERELPLGEPAPVMGDPWGQLRALPKRPLITEPGIYPDLTNEQYHGAEPCDAPSISSTGLKKLVPHVGLQAKGHSPRHYWEGSPLNPNRRPQVQTDALRFGSAFHDALLLEHRWNDPAVYHFLPEGFNRAASKQQADAIARADAAEAAGATLIKMDEQIHIEAMVQAVREHPNANAILSAGVAEMTLAWKDEETGVWVRIRPDFIAFGRPIGINVKSTTDASHAGFQSDVTKYRYAQSAALEMDGLRILADHIKALFPKFVPPTHYLHPTVEKPGKDWTPGDYLPVALWELPAEDIEYGRALNRRAIRIFADCLSSDTWPGYADAPQPCGISGWAKKQIDLALEMENA